MSEQYEHSHLYKLRHTAAHVLAQAVLELYPQAKLASARRLPTGFIMILIWAWGERPFPNVPPR